MLCNVFYILYIFRAIIIFDVFLILEFSLAISTVTQSVYTGCILICVLFLLFMLLFKIKTFTKLVFILIKKPLYDCVANGSC